MNREERAGIIAETEKLREAQNTPDRPEDLATIPVLRLDDLDRRGRDIPSRS